MRIGFSALSVIAFAAAPAGLPAVAPAAAVTASGAVHGGRLSVSGIPARIIVPKLRVGRGGWRQAVVRVPVTVTDARGTGAGWGLALAAAARTLDGHPARGVTVSVWTIDVRCTGCTRPRARAVLPVSLAEGSAVRVFAARKRSGMGRMRLIAQVVVTAPASTAPGPYLLRPTLSRIAGP